MSLQATTWQTVGPYFRIGLEARYATRIAPADTPGEHVEIHGALFDGMGRPVPDAVIETWQADADGVYARTSGSFRGFGRIPTDGDGRFSFKTIKPGRVPGPNGAMQSPHLAVRIMMRGLLKSLVTRMYFPCEEVAGDPILQLVPAERRATLIAARSADSDSTYLWNIELQGERETVFFDC